MLRYGRLQIGLYRLRYQNSMSSSCPIGGYARRFHIDRVAPRALESYCIDHRSPAHSDCTPWIILWSDLRVVSFSITARKLRIVGDNNRPNVVMLQLPARNQGWPFNESHSRSVVPISGANKWFFQIPASKLAHPPLFTLEIALLRLMIGATSMVLGRGSIDLT